MAQEMTNRQAAMELLEISKDLAAKIKNADSLTDKYRHLLQFSCSVSNGAAIHARASFTLFKKAQALVSVACEALDEAGEVALAEEIRRDLRDAMDAALMETGSEGTHH